MAEIWGAAIAAAGAIGGGLLASRGAGRAADASAAGSQAAIDEQRRQFDIVMGLQAPFQATGVGANNMLARLYGLPTAQAGAPSSGGGFTPGGGGAPGGGMSSSGALLRGVDPLGLYSGGSVNARRLLDPFGLSGGGGGDTGRFNAGPRPEGHTGSRFRPSDVVSRLQQGMSIEDIAKAGWLSTMEGDPSDIGDKEIRYLHESGLTPEQIAMLQGRGTAPGGAPGTDGGVTTPSGPDMSVFFASPDYEFRRGEGTRGIENSFSARGGAKSGNALRALAEFNSGLASGEYGDFVNRLLTMSGRGQTSATNTGNAALQTGSNVGNALVNMGNARASGIEDQTNAWGDALGSLGGAFGSWMRNRGQSRNRSPSGFVGSW